MTGISSRTREVCVGHEIYSTRARVHKIPNARSLNTKYYIYFELRSRNNFVYSFLTDKYKIIITIANYFLRSRCVFLRLFSSAGFIPRFKLDGLHFCAENRRLMSNGDEAMRGHW